MKIGKKIIGRGYPCFIIAELSGNHHQKYNEAAKLVEAAAKAGADAIKLQTYTPDTITLNSREKWFIVGGKDQPHSWKQKTLYELYRKTYTPWEWQPKLKKVAEGLGLILFSSPFDETAVDFLEAMDIPCYKIASYEVVHIPLLRKVAKTGKPVIMSIGFASLAEVKLALHTLQENGATEIVLLHCLTAYSDKPEAKKANLRTISDIQKRFKVISGFSDNNAGIEVPLVATAVAGASVIEKHLILDRKKGGHDSRFSIEPEELKKMISLIRKTEREGLKEVLKRVVNKNEIKNTMGKVHYGPASDKEKENMLFRPSIWVKKNIKKGGKFTLKNIRVARPSHGLAPKFFDEVMGKIALRNIERGTPLNWRLVK